MYSVCMYVSVCVYKCQLSGHFYAVSKWESMGPTTAPLTNQKSSRKSQSPKRKQWRDYRCVCVCVCVCCRDWCYTLWGLYSCIICGQCLVCVHVCIAVCT